MKKQAELLLFWLLMQRTLPGSRFSALAPVSQDYPTLPVAEAFNWQDCGSESGEWCLIAFRSVLRETADIARLWEQDELAWQQAAAMPGFVHYFRGLPNARRQCLSFCLWDSWPQARAAARLGTHLEAIELVHDTFEHFELEFFSVVKESATSGYEFVPRASR
jgi:hypothetical protein